MITDVKKRATHHSKIIEGQFKALVEAVENETYCVDILTQSLAIQQSLRSLNRLILENHMRTHVKDGFKNGSQAEVDELISEMLQIYNLSEVKK